MTTGPNPPNMAPPCEPPSQQKVIVHTAYPLWRKQALLTMARAKELQDQGNEVTLTYCNSKAGTCAANYAGSPIACWICRNRVKSTAAALGIQAIPLETGTEAGPSNLPPSMSEKKKLAEGVQSGITSTFRTFIRDSNASRVISRIKRRYFCTSSRLLQSLKNLALKKKPDRIEVFNGRHACSRLALITAESLQIPFNTLEGTTRQKPIIFRGHTPHDRIAIQKRMMQHAADPQVADSYYRQRRQPKNNKFARKHALDFAPPRAEHFQRKASIFLSSQDEFESLGKAWVSPFLNYAPIVYEACLQNPETLFCIRFHPNQADISSDVITPFQKTAALPNTCVYYPTDNANTYTLIEWSDLVITFGSTVTVEACWMQKPVIQLGPSFFDQLDVSYNPTTCQEFLELLTKDLPPKDRQNAARVANFEEYDFDPFRYVEFNGKTMVAKDLKIARPWSSQLARTTDDLFCNAIKSWTGFWSKRKRDAA
ncbi:MAG TPA: hypothetical protein DHW22_10200 [Planctomycetaceae bacterium]|nr:hypothetical protein [Planctomycetaceae bacterium]